MLLKKQCVCGALFIPNTKKQKYCSAACRDRYKVRRYRSTRKEKGLCPQCGREMDYPVRIGKGKDDGKYISYCSRCRDYFRRKYLESYVARSTAKDTVKSAAK